MKIWVTVTREIVSDGFWVDDATAENMSDSEIIELVTEDVNAFFDGASITVTRTDE